jgi:recombinational DNA repair ATPase RecF
MHVLRERERWLREMQVELSMLEDLTDQRLINLGVTLVGHQIRICKYRDGLLLWWKLHSA